MSLVDKAPEPAAEPILTRLFGPLIWVTVLIGAPIIAIVSDHMATALIPKSFPALRISAWLVLLLLYLTYTNMFRKQLRTVIDDLIRAPEVGPGTNPSKAASTIASAVALGLMLIATLLVLDYYGHREAADFSARSKAFEDAKAEREKEASRQATLAALPPINVRAGNKLFVVPEAVDLKSQPASKHSKVEHTLVQRVGASSNATPTSPPVVAEAGALKPEPSALEVAGTFLGTFGDFFGGVLNPLLTFGTLVALAITILLQRTQLDLAEGSASRDSKLMEKQAFETTFFNMLNLHNTTVQDLTFDPKTIEIPVWYGDGEEDEGDIDYDNQSPDELQPPLNMPNAEGRQVFARVLQLMDSKLHGSTPTAVYHRIQKYHNYILGHYFRTLYQLLELVEEYSEDAGYEEATRYSSIVRAQLSANELILLFFNCGYELVDSGEFRKLLKRYEILEHMPLRHGVESGTLDTPGYHFFIETHINQYFKGPEDRETVFSEAGAFGENPAVKEYLEQL